ncbi:MAG TPA: amino acid ABC transporter permease [Armatimonadetes bacterium]|jgi:polar amino acid transport system permease protein|nr:amino acid ABC transporter permease [Armatimonadota bacterium]
MELGIYLHESSFLVKALGVTAILAVGAAVLGTVVAAILALLRMSQNKAVSRAATYYVEFMRGTPLLVQLFIIFYGGPQVGLTLEPMTAGILGLGLNAGAYISEIFRGAIQSIPEGQMEAARSLGMGHWLAMRRVIWPQALRHAVPALGSSFAALVKDTSLASVITVHELLLTTQQRISFRGKPIEFYLMAGILYFLLTMAVTYSIRWWERQYKWSI